MRLFSSVQFCSFLLLIFRVNYALTIQEDDKDGCENNKVENNIFRILPTEVPSDATNNYTGSNIDIFKAIANDSDVKKSSDIVDRGYYSSLCWSEITTFTDRADGSKLVTKEYAITFETQADIPQKYLNENGIETEEYVIYDQQTKKSQIVNFTTVSRTDEEVIRQNRNMFCGSGPVYSKEYIEWPQKNKKRFEIKVSPKRYNLKISPVRKELEQHNGSSLAIANNISAPETIHKIENSTEVVAATTRTIPTFFSRNDSSVLGLRTDLGEHVSEKDYEISSNPTISTVERLSVTTSLPTTVYSGDDTLMEVSDRIGLSDNFSNNSNDESVSLLNSSFQQHAKNDNRVVPDSNPPLSKCEIFKQKILITVRVSISHVLESSIMDSTIMPLMNLKKEVDIPVVSIPKVLTVPNDTINEEWSRFLEDIGTYFFNLNKKIFVNFTNLFINTTNNGESFLPVNDILPRETIKRIKIVRDQINQCKILLPNNDEVHLPAQYGYLSKQYNYLHPPYFEPKSSLPLFYPSINVLRDNLKNPYGSYSYRTNPLDPAYISQKQGNQYSSNWLMPNNIPFYTYGLPNYLQQQ